MSKESRGKEEQRGGFQAEVTARTLAVPGISPAPEHTGGAGSGGGLRGELGKGFEGAPRTLMFILESVDSAGEGAWQGSLN